ncbi:hypothetical protein CU100_03550 [Phyllobacterium endophyticum]|uniref:Uncharacterized protein n=1 Tax=Phyllobacterium endophyticum TaxID=1149773 RepID=A0A2P7B049_9HYPH|nr:hypothetical protein CU100_03550 [Phyllobacterium endophyticum]
MASGMNVGTSGEKVHQRSGIGGALPLLIATLTPLPAWAPLQLKTLTPARNKELFIVIFSSRTSSIFKTIL